MDKDNIGRVIAIEYKGRGYDHYAILDGLGNVIHVNKKKGLITLDPLDKVLRNATKVTYLNDDFDTRYRTYNKAVTLIGCEHSYKFWTNNCEDFVQKLRTGQAYSKQVNDSISMASAAILLASSILGIGQYL